MTKYQEIYKKMLADNKELFDEFRIIHDAYNLDSSHQDEYNQKGKPVIELIREYEDRLCGRSEGSGYAAYSGNLAEKFWTEIRRDFPMIDRVGVVIRKANPQPDFDLKKIEMFEINKIKLV